MESTIDRPGTWNKGRANANKGKKLSSAPLSRDEIQQLLRQCSGRCPTGIRNKALLTLLWRCGLRISEALALAPSDIDAARGSLTVRHGKGDKQRIIGIDPQTQAVIDRWLDHRAEFASRESPLFCTLEGEPVQASYIRALLPRLAHRAGITRRVHAHAFRHTFASEMRREVQDTGIISKTLGHSNLRTTIIYLDHVAPEEVINTMRQRTW